MTRVGVLTDEELAQRRMTVYRLLEAVEVVDLSRPILRRASVPFPVPLGTLDALHLATALSWRDARDADLTVATHDQALAMAARSVGLPVIGA
jgi:hypothetical protein